MTHKLFSLIVVLMVSGLIVVMPVMAQRDMATMLGSVTDPSGAAIPGASITIVEESTGVADLVDSDATGNYIRPLIKPGIYTVSCESPGFKTSVQTGVTLQSSSRVQAKMPGLWFQALRTGRPSGPLTMNASIFWE